jgi:hypothetical protein
MLANLYSDKKKYFLLLFSPLIISN